MRLAFLQKWDFGMSCACKTAVFCANTIFILLPLHLEKRLHSKFLDINTLPKRFRSVSNMPPFSLQFMAF